MSEKKDARQVAHKLANHFLATGQYEGLKPGEVTLPEPKVEPEASIEIIVAPGVTEEQLLAFLNLISDAFIACSGRGGLKIEEVEPHD